MLKVNQLAFKNILKEIHLTIPQNKITLLLGKSGSGKTTLLRCIAQLESDYKGEILCNETLLKDLSPRQRSQIVGFIPQSYPLFPHMSILDNCTLSLRIQLGMDRIKANQKALDLLRLFNIDTLARSMPSEISGGQRQRAAIVRALVLDPSFLLFDEPTSALDPENTTLFVQLVKTLQEQGKGIAISTQDMQLAAQIFDRTYFLEDGHVIEFHEAQGKTPCTGEGRTHQFLMRTSLTPELALQHQSVKSP